MGPAAALDFVSRIVENTPASRDQDHLHVLLDNDPRVPDRTAALLNGGLDPLPHLVRIARRLITAGADLLVMPCNTAAHWHALLQAEVAPVELVDWVGVVAEQITEPVVVLGTPGTDRAGIYRQRLGKFARPMPSGAVRDEIAAIITAVKAGARPVAALESLIDKLSCPALLGCTELSLLRPHGDAVDPSDLVARYTVTRCTASISSSKV
jgi:aspartate racemase